MTAGKAPMSFDKHCSSAILCYKAAEWQIAALLNRLLTDSLALQCLLVSLKRLRYKPKFHMSKEISWVSILWFSNI